MKIYKYVIIDEFKPVVFDAPLIHKDMAAVGVITSAGYFVVDGGSLAIMGEAISIPVKNGEHDQKLLAKFLAVQEL